MRRLTSDQPQENQGTLLNYVFSEDGWAHIRHDGVHDNVLLTEWARKQCHLRGCELEPGETPEDVDLTLCDCIVDSPDCPVALAYCFACQAVHLRDRLKLIEDILGDTYDLDHLRELVDAKKNWPAQALLLAELKRQDELWGDQSGNHPFEWMSILGEEYGELCEAVNETCFKNPHHPERSGYDAIIREATHVAAVALHIMDAMLTRKEAEAEKNEPLTVEGLRDMDGEVATQ